jgi:hypothetical protein
MCEAAQGLLMQIEDHRLARRPKLAGALAHAKKLNAPVIVSTLCRLGRDVHFISGLMSNHVPFIVAELGPHVDPFMLHIRSVKLGKTERQRAKENKAAADAQARALAPTIRALGAAGITSPPRAVLIFRLFSSSAMARKVTKPASRSSRAIGAIALARISAALRWAAPLA